ncbi:dUTP diphosphatase [archaeon]|nr:dUTP diphosphatase [archaeon]
MKLEIQKINSEAKLPNFAHTGDAGMDLFAVEDCIIDAGSRVLVPTGIVMKIPFGYVGLIWDKSGLAVKHGITMLAGVIDSGYRGEIKIVVQNLGSKPFEVVKGNKIGQMLIQAVVQPEIVEVEELDKTSRSAGSFGSTGEK